MIFPIWLLIYAVILVGFSQLLFISDSEFWSWNVGVNLSQMIHEPWFWDRPLFYFIIGSVTHLTDRIWISLLLTRSLAAAWCWGVIFLTSLIVYEKTKQRWLAFLSSMLLMANLTFAGQSYRIRSDMLSVFFILFGVWLHIRGNKKWSFLVGALGLLVTPKAGLFALPFVFFLVRDRLKFKMVMGVLLALILAWFAVGGVDRHMLYLQESALQLLQRGHFDAHLTQIKDNAWFWLLLSVTLFSTLVKTKRGSPLIYGLIYFLSILFLFPDYTSFLFAALLPFFVIILCLLIFPWLQSQKLARSALLVSIGIFSLWTPLTWYLISTQGAGLKDQVQFLSKVDHFMTEHKLSTFYDGLGALPHRLLPPVYLGPNQANFNSKTVATIRESNPDMIMAVSRMDRLGEEFQRYVNNYFHELAPGLFIRIPIVEGQGCRSEPRTEFFLPWLAHHHFRLKADAIYDNRILVRPDDLEVLKSKDTFRSFQKNVLHKRQLTTTPEPCYLAFYFPDIQLRDLGPYHVNELFRVDQ